MSDLKLVIASNNQDKIREIQSILGNSFLKVVSYRDIFNRHIEAVEDGDTFKANAIKKVEIFPPRDDIIYLGEDSGLVVDWLNGAPGIYSARYAGENTPHKEKCYKILQEMHGAGNRDARFVAAMAVRFPDETVDVVEAKVEGRLAHEYLGENGFGYDPIFMPEEHEETFGQLEDSLKQGLSHRYRALMKVKPLIEAFVGTPV